MRIWLLIGALLMLLIACEKKTEEVVVDPVQEITEEQVIIKEKEDAPVFNRGQTIDHVYTNNFFNVRYVLPNEWLVLTLDELDALMHLGENILESENGSLSKSLETSEVYSLMGVVKYSTEQKVSVNPSMIISAEKIDPSSEVKDGQGYLEKSKEILVSTGIPYEFEGDARTVIIDGQDYGILEASIDTGDDIIGQSYYALYSKGYVVNIIMTYTEEDGMAELEALVGD